MGGRLLGQYVCMRVVRRFGGVCVSVEIVCGLPNAGVQCNGWVVCANCVWVCGWVGGRYRAGTARVHVRGCVYVEYRKSNVGAKCVDLSSLARSWKLFVCQGNACGYAGGWVSDRGLGQHVCI